MYTLASNYLYCSTSKKSPNKITIPAIEKSKNTRTCTIKSVTNNQQIQSKTEIAHITWSLNVESRSKNY